MTDLSTVTYPAGSQNVTVTLSRRLPSLVVVGLADYFNRTTADHVRAILGADMPRCRVVAEVVRPGGGYPSEEVTAAIVAGIRHLAGTGGVCS